MFKFLLFSFIRFYQIFISPFFPSSCFFKISCSNNFLMCLEKHGLSLGFYFGCKQIVLCNPWFFKKKGVGCG